MGGEESREEKKLENLSPVSGNGGKKYVVCTLLGEGNFGGVFKVQNVKTKEFFALKCVPIDAQPGVNENQQRVVYKTALTEEKLLDDLRHKNIVKIYESFICPRNPAKPKEKSKSKKTDRWFCMILEYCRGNTLEAVLQQVEKSQAQIKLDKEKKKEEENLSKKKKIKSSNQSDSKKFKIPRDICIIWFLKLLETVEFIHSKKVIHCDLHAENVLLKYNDLYDFRNIELRISDFGVAKDISKAKNEKDLPCDLSGHIFYSAPEVINQKNYDGRADVWALGILFLNIYTRMSMSVYIAVVQRIFLKIKQNPELRDQFCEKYNIKDYVAVHRIPNITMLAFIHSKEQIEMNNLFMKQLVYGYVKDGGVKSVIETMLSPYDERKTSKELLNSKIIKTWKFLLSREDNISDDSKFLEFFSMKGIITILKMKDDFLFNKCLRLLKGFILVNPLEFVENGGIEVLFKRMNGVRKVLISINRKFVKKNKNVSDPSIRNTMLKLHRQTNNPLLNQDLLRFECLLADIISLTTCVLCWLQLNGHVKIYDEELKKICIYVRRFECLTTLESLLKFQKNDSIYYFTYLCCQSSKSIRSYLTTLENLRSLLNNMDERNQNYIIAILSSLMSEIDKKYLSYVMDNYKKNIPNFRKSNDVRFFKKCKFKSVIYKNLLLSLYQEIVNLVGRNNINNNKENDESKDEETDELKLLLDENEESNVIRVLCSIIFVIQEFNKSNEIWKKEKLYLDKFLMKIDNTIDFGSGSRAKKGVNEIVLINKEQRTFEVLISKEAKENNQEIEITSSDAICKFKEKDEDCLEEYDVSYFEVYCEDGGFQDDLIIGYNSTAMKPCQIYMHVATGNLVIKKLGEKETKIKENYFSEDEEEDKFDDFSNSQNTGELKCETGDSIGCGITNFGRVFWTRNNNILFPKKFVQFYPFTINSKIPISMKPSILLLSNIGFKGRLILPNVPNHIPFRFKFSKIFPEGMYRCIEQKARDRVKNKIESLGNCTYFLEEIQAFKQIDRVALKFVRQQSDPGNFILGLAKGKYEDNEFIQQLISRIEGFSTSIDSSDKKVSEEEENRENELSNILYEIYNEPCYQEKIVNSYFKLTSSEYRKNFVEFEKKSFEQEEKEEFNYPIPQEKIEEEIEGEEEESKEENNSEVKKEIQEVEKFEENEKSGEDAEKKEEEVQSDEKNIQDQTPSLPTSRKKSKKPGRSPPPPPRKTEEEQFEIVEDVKEEKEEEKKTEEIVPNKTRKKNDN